MGLILILILWPAFLAFGIFAIILPYIPMMIFGMTLLLFVIGLILNHTFKKHEVYQAGQNSQYKAVNVGSSLLHSFVKVDIVLNLILMILAVVAQIIFIAKGIYPFMGL